MAPIQRLIRRFVLRIVAHPKWTLLISAVILCACIVLSLSRLRVSSDENKLFSTKVKFFREFVEFDDKFPENDALYVVIEPANAGTPPPVELWTRLADEITERLREMPEAVDGVDSRVPLDQLGPHGLLFDQPESVRQTVEDLKQFAPLVRLWGEKPGPLTALLGSSPLERFTTSLLTQSPDADHARFVELLARSWVVTLEHPAEPMQIGRQLPDLASLDASDPSRLGYYYVADESDTRQPKQRHILLVRVFPRVDYTTLSSIYEPIESIRAAVAQASKSFPQFKVGITGRPAISADEMQITDRDSTAAETVAMIVIFIALTVMLRSLWLALAAEIALAVGIGWTFGWATLTLGELNLLSMVFLIALIGIGMDYLVQILIAYRREARRRVRQSAIWSRVFISVGPPINTACLGAAAAFLVSVFTDFRGAADLGIIAGGGLLLCLISGYTVLPALLVLVPPKLKPIDASQRFDVCPARGGGWRWLTPLTWIALLLLGIPFMRRTEFNPNLLDLQAPKLPSVELVRKLQTWSAVVLSKDPVMLRLARDAVADAPSVSSTESILLADDNAAWLKSQHAEMPVFAWAAPARIKSADIDRLSGKMKLLAEHFGGDSPAGKSASRVAALLALPSETSNDPRAEQLSLWQVGFIEQLRTMLTQLSPPPLQPRNLPAELRKHLLSDDGFYALYIYPKDDLWKKEPLERFVREVESRVASVRGAPSVTGLAPNMYHTTASIKQSFIRATLYALAIIVLLVFLDLRSVGQTLMAISVLGLGLPMLVAIMGLLGIDWNMANFFGLPILIGAGHEYGVFLVHRYREALHNPRRAWARWDYSDRALMLCAFITSSSFGFFWAMGHHRGLKSLGLVMALGTGCIYLASLLVLRPLLLRLLPKRA